MPKIFEYELNESKESYTVTKYVGDGYPLVNFPESYNGKPVTHIDKNVFVFSRNAYLIQELTFPKTVDEIEVDFSMCYQLTDICIINENVKLSRNSFSDCKKLENVNSFAWKYLNLEQLNNIIPQKINELNNLTEKEQRFIIYFVSQRPNLKKDLFLSENLMAIKFLFDQKTKISLDDLKDILDHYTTTKMVEITSMFMDYKYKNYTEDEIKKFDENYELVEIGFELPTYKQLLQKWNVGKLKNGLRISGYKKNNINETIPVATADGQKIISIGYNPKSDFKPIQHLTISAEISVINQRTFEACHSLLSIKLPNSLRIIGEEAFAFCEYLTEIEIPEGVTHINKLAFDHCLNLKRVVFPSTLSKLSLAGFARCKSLVDVTIRPGVAVLPHAFFSICDSLEVIELPNSIVEISSRVFADCPSLKTVTLSQKLTTIGEFCFADCTALEEIVFPASLMKIENCAFGNCPNLKSVVFNSEVTMIGDVFKGSPNVQIVNNY